MTTATNQIFTDVLTAEAGQTSFEVSREYVVGTISVFRNGVPLIPSIQFNATQGTYVEVLITLSENDEIIITGVSAEPIESQANPGTTFFDRLGFNFDKNKFGAALNVSGYSNSYYSSNPIKLKQWQKDLLKSGVYRNYYKNPLAESINEIRTTITTIRNTIIQVISANTPKYITTPLGGVQLIKEGLPIPAGKANANTLKVLANTANVALNSLNVLRSHTDRISGVVVSSSEDPDYEKAMGVGTNISRIVNAVDGVSDFSPILGSFTSLFIRDDMLVYLNQIKNFQNELLEILPIQNWTTENYFERSLIGFDSFSVERIRTPAVKSFDVSAVGTNEVGLFIGNNGTRLYVTENVGNTVGQWTLTTPWDVSTATGLVEQPLNSTTNQNYTASSIIDVSDAYFNPDGDKFYHLDIIAGSAGENRTIYEYSLTENWNVLTANCVTNSKINVAAISTVSDPRGMWFKPTGESFYVTDNSNDTIAEFSMSIPFQVNTASFVKASSSIVPPEYYNITTDQYVRNSISITPRAIRFTDDGRKIFVSETTVGLVMQYALSTPWDISTISFVSAVFGLGGVNVRGLELRQNGADFYVLSLGQNRVWNYQISPASTLNFSANDSVKLANNFSFLSNLSLTRVNHDKNYYKKSVEVLNDYNKMVQLTSIPAPPAIVMIRDLIGTDELKKLL